MLLYSAAAKDSPEMVQLEENILSVVRDLGALFDLHYRISSFACLQPL
jgi:hypothetical protein